MFVDRRAFCRHILCKHLTANYICVYYTRSGLLHTNRLPSFWDARTILRMIKLCQELSGILLYWLSNKRTGHFHEFRQQTHFWGGDRRLITHKESSSWRVSIFLRHFPPPNSQNSKTCVTSADTGDYVTGEGDLRKTAFIRDRLASLSLWQKRNYLVFKAISHKTRHCLFQGWLVYKKAFLKTYSKRKAVSKSACKTYRNILDP